MSHSITCKLNKDARQHPNASGVTFFVSLGEKNYNFKTKETEYYEAALFAKDAQIQFYTDILVEGSVIGVSGTGIIIEPPSDPKYSHRLQIQDAKLGFVHTSVGAQAQQAAPQQAMQQAPVQQAAPQHMAPQPAPQPQVDIHAGIIQEYNGLPNPEAKTAMWATLQPAQQTAIINAATPF